MASFDFIDASAQGYRFVWQNRLALVRLGGALVALKTLAIVLISALGLTDQYLRQGFLQLLPYFAEGWVICYVIRWSVLGETWFSGLTGNPQKDGEAIQRRSNEVMAGTLVYALIKLVTIVAVGLAMTQAGAEKPVEGGGNSVYTLAAFFLLFIGIWLFRFLWLYVPVALGYTMREYLFRLGGLLSSICMIGVWLICFVPAALVTLVLTQNIYAAMDVDLEVAASSLSLGQTAIIGALHALGDTFVALVAAVAMGHGIKAMMMAKE